MEKRYIMTESEYKVVSNAVHVLDFCLQNIKVEKPYIEDMRRAVNKIESVLTGGES